MIRTHEESDDAGEGYFASISDLMVGILFIFLLMLTVFAINYANDDVKSLKAEIERLRSENGLLTRERDGLLNTVSRLALENVLLTRERDDLVDTTARLARENLSLTRQRDDLLDKISRLAHENLLLTRQRDELLASVGRLARDLDELNAGLRGEQGRLEGVRKDLLFQLQSRLESRGVKVEVDQDQGILRLSSEGLFELNEARFTPKGQENARALLEEMARLMPCYAKASSFGDECDAQQPIFETVLIEGHTDTRPTQRTGGNWTLSTDRARAFMELMGNSAASSLRDLRNGNSQPLLGLAGYGDSRPRSGVPGEDAGNRRIETRFLLAAQQATMGDRLRTLDAIIEELKSLRSSTR